MNNVPFQGKRGEHNVVLTEQCNSNEVEGVGTKSTKVCVMRASFPSLQNEDKPNTEYAELTCKIKILRAYEPHVKLANIRAGCYDQNTTPEAIQSIEDADGEASTR